MAEKSPPVPAIDLDVALVRQTLMRELETINAYEEFARKATREDIRVFLSHLAAEEKEHVAEATNVLRQLDPEQERIFQTAGGLEHFRKETGRHVWEHSEQPAERPAESPPKSSWSVGPLKGSGR